MAFIAESDPGNRRRFDTGTFSFDASSSTTTVSDSQIFSTSQVMIFPVNITGALHERTQTVWVDGIVDGSFVANMSATAAGIPAAASTWAYFVLSE